MPASTLHPLRYRAPVIPTLVSAIGAAVLSTTTALAGVLVLLTVAGAHTFPVASDSMEPVFVRGDLVVTKPVAGLQIDDVVTFRKYGQLVTHRIVAAGRAPGTFETRGDANPGNDPWTITIADVVGRVVTVVHRAGSPLLAVQTVPGRLIAANLLVAVVLLMCWALPRATRIPCRVLHPSSGYDIV